MTASSLPIDTLTEIAKSLNTVIAMMTSTRPGKVARVADDARDLRLYQRTRRLRDLYFPPALFADGCWDILIDLYAAQQERSLVSVTSACIAAAVPSTTALRQIQMLERAGILHRAPDPFDRRRSYLELSEAGLHAMQDYFAAVARMVATDGALR